MMKLKVLKVLIRAGENTGFISISLIRTGENTAFKQLVDQLVPEEEEDDLPSKLTLN